MYIARIAIIGVQPEFPSSSEVERDVYAEIIVIDRTFSQHRPLVYQLANDVLSEELAIELPLQHYGRLIYGEILSIDKQKKEILLAEGMTLHYRHLITVCGEGRRGESRDAELAAGLVALKGTLKVQERLASALSPQTTRRRLHWEVGASGGDSLKTEITTLKHLLHWSQATRPLPARCLYQIQP